MYDTVSDVRPPVYDADTMPYPFTGDIEAPPPSYDSLLGHTQRAISKWVKLCTINLTCRCFQLQLGENMDYYEYNATLGEPGGLHFCKVENALEWADMLNYDWVCDVTIPPDAEVTHGDDKSKASKVILTNHRPLRECPDIYLTTVQQNGFALQYVPEDLKTPVM